MENGITFVGLDAHKKKISVAMLVPGQTVPVQWDAPNEAAAVKRMVRRIEREASEEVRFCYEAGALGYALQRQITEAGSEKVSCMVVAPSLIPRKPGERIKTDRRDARWTARHRLWLRGLRFEHASEADVSDDYLLAIEQLEARLRGLEEKLESVAQKTPYAEPVGWLRCFRGIDTVTAMTIVTELYSFERFHSPRGLMAFLGLVPSEQTSGYDPKRGRITRMGNSHVRRILIEAAWHYRHRPAVVSLRKRRQGQPAEIIALADKAQQRLHRRYRRMTEKGIPAPKAVTAVARELAGFVWAALRHTHKASA
jgi:transposase